MAGLPGLSAATAWSVLTRQGSTAEARFATRTDVTRETERFRERAPTIKTPEALLKDRRTLEFVLTSYGLESEIGKTAILRKLMTQNPDAQGSLANQMTDQRYRQFARDFSNWSPRSPFERTGGMDTIVERWTTATYESSAGQDNPGLREALYFARNAGGATTVLQLMADKALAYVVRVGLGLPAQFEAVGFDQQRAVLEKRVDLTQFQDPKQLDRFIKRFLVRYELENGSASGSSPTVSLFQNSGGGTGGLFGVLGSRLNLRA
jgi:hypothetical protein